MMGFGPFSCPASLPPAQFGLAELTRRLRSVPQARQIIGRGRQRQLDGDFLQSTSSELPHPTLFFQHPKDRFDQSLASPIDRSPQRAAQLLPHPSVHRMLGPTPQASAPVQHARQVRVMRTSSIRIIPEMSIVINNMILNDKIYLSSFHTDSSGPTPRGRRGMRRRHRSAEPPQGRCAAPAILPARENQLLSGPPRRWMPSQWSLRRIAAESPPWGPTPCSKWKAPGRR